MTDRDYNKTFFIQHLTMQKWANTPSTIKGVFTLLIHYIKKKLKYGTFRTGISVDIFLVHAFLFKILVV